MVKHFELKIDGESRFRSKRCMILNMLNGRCLGGEAPFDSRMQWRCISSYKSSKGSVIWKTSGG